MSHKKTPKYSSKNQLKGWFFGIDICPILRYNVLLAVILPTKNQKEVTK